MNINKSPARSSTHSRMHDRIVSINELENENKSDRSRCCLLIENEPNECIIPFNVKQASQGHCQSNDWRARVKNRNSIQKNFILLRSPTHTEARSVFYASTSSMLIIKVLVFVFNRHRTDEREKNLSTKLAFNCDDNGVQCLCPHTSLLSDDRR